MRLADCTAAVTWSQYFGFVCPHILWVSDASVGEDGRTRHVQLLLFSGKSDIKLAVVLSLGLPLFLQRREPQILVRVLPLHLAQSKTQWLHLASLVLTKCANLCRVVVHFRLQSLEFRFPCVRCIFKF